MIVKEILELYSAGNIKLEVGFYMLAEQGACPNLLNDDYGHWAVSFGDYQDVSPNPGEPSSIRTSFFVEKEYWHKTIADAFMYALKRAQDENEETTDPQ